MPIVSFTLLDRDGDDWFRISTDNMYYQPSPPRSCAQFAYWYNTATGAQSLLVGVDWKLVRLSLESLEEPHLARHQRIVAATERRVSRRKQAEIEDAIREEQEYQAELARILANGNYGRF